MKERSLVKVFALNLITLGVYYLYWLHATRREMINLGAKNIWSIWILIIPIVGLMALFLLFMLNIFSSEIGDTTKDFSMLEVVINILLFIGGALFVVASIVIPFLWTWRYSKGVAFVTRGKVSTDYSFWLYVLVTFFGFEIIWQLILQNDFNTLARGGHAAGVVNHDVVVPDASDDTPSRPSTPHTTKQ